MKKTRELDEKLKKITDPKDVPGALAEEGQRGVTLSEYINVLLDQKNMTAAQAIAGSNLSAGYANNIINGSREKPSRDKVIALSFGLKATPEEADRLLKLAGHSPLYSRSSRDGIILVCLREGKSLMRCEEILDEFRLGLIGAE